VRACKGLPTLLCAPGDLVHHVINFRAEKMIANNRRTETFDVQSVSARRFAAIHFVTGWANECVECMFGVTNGRLVSGQWSVVSS
jgi:hypothetical protein